MSNVAQQQVPEGYKQTEVGVVPAEWNIISIERALKANLIVDQMDGNHGELYPKSHEFSHSGVPYVGANDFDGGKVNFKSCKYIAEKRAAHFKKGIAKNGDVLFAHNATVGPVALVETNLEYIILSTTATYYRCDNKSLINKYLKAYFESEHFVGQYTAVMSQSTRNQVPILAQRKFLLVVPPVEEQTAIANALSDADALITSLEKLIAKKRAIKTAAMQQLLTGKKRLPPFDQTHTGYKQTELGEIPKDWEVGVVRDLVDNMSSGLSRRLASHDIGLPVLISGNIRNNKLVTNELKYWYKDDPQGAKTEDYVLNEGDILLCFINSMSQIGKPCIFIDIGRPAIYTTNLFRIVISNIHSAEFAYFLFISEVFQKQIQLISKIAVNQASFTKPDFLHIKISYPSDRREQRAIAKVLSDMDEEVDAFEQRLIKTQQLKQGMMQELLTGRTRLV